MANKIPYTNGITNEVQGYLDLSDVLKDIDKKPKKKKRYWHCQAAEEMNPKCEYQCDHCERYYAPIDDPK